MSRGFEGDRDIVACLNILRMRGAPFPLNAPYEVLELDGEGRFSATKVIKVAESQNGQISHA